MRYDLDKLGWYEFERLCQVLLKVRLGLGVEAWGGSKDWGRDAYYGSLLTYPNNDTNNGPFLFQCKFINDANAAGAKYDKLILDAVRKECASLRKKIPVDLPQADKEAKGARWKLIPQFFTLMTNARISPQLYTQVEQIILHTLPESKFVKQDGNDLCAWLDSTNGIAKKFPQILGLNDLETLLSSLINSDIITRSMGAIIEAKEISKVFVPTEAYSKAHNVLFRNKYVVLEGPPEVGKTAIGRMIGLSLMSEGWEVYECSSPIDVLSMYNNSDSTVKQVFIADDSFGRTGYDSSRVNLWQTELPNILRKLNPSRLLILTSRKHLIEMAKDKLDISGAHDDFPKTGEVLVDVSVLSPEEKALMVYRHMKNANFSNKLKTHLKKIPNRIISDRNFTPERIRFMVDEFKKKETVIVSDEGYNLDAIGSIIQNSMSTPSDRMRKTYRQLPIAHKWFMISVLIHESSDVIYFFREECEEIIKIYNKLCPPDEHVDFSSIMNQLSEAFIKTHIADKRTSISWIHPSCGDMVAKELSQNARDKLHFINNCDMEGIKYLLSIGGGANGEIVMPLLKTNHDWHLFEDRLKSLEGPELSIIEEIVSTVSYLCKNIAYKQEQIKLEKILSEILLPKYINYYNSQGWNLKNLLLAFGLKNKSGGNCSEIDYEKLWFQLVEDAINDMAGGECVIWNDCCNLDRIIKLNNFLYKNVPNYFDKETVKKAFGEMMTKCIIRGKKELNLIMSPEEEDYAEWAEGYDDCSKMFNELSKWAQEESDKNSLDEIALYFNDMADDYESQIQREPDYDDEYRDEGGRSQSSFSSEKLFRDL